MSALLPSPTMPFPGRSRSCLRTICTSASLGAQRWRERGIYTSDLLCQYHRKQQLPGHRHHSQRRLRTSEAGGGASKDQPLVCQAMNSASFGPQPGSFPAWVWGWGGGWLGNLARFYYYYREILTRAVLTVGLLAIIRCGHFIPMPGIDLALVSTAGASTAGERLIKALYGQAQDIPASLFDLGISPFVNASILLAVALVLPQEMATLPGLSWLSRLREARKEGRTGEALINSTTNLVALCFAVYLGLVRAFELEPCAVLGGGGMFVPQTVLALVAGSACIHMCASTITAFGLGNGSSLVICSSIITEYASTLHTVLCSLDTSLLSPARLAAMLGGYLALVLTSVWLSTAELRLPLVQYATSAPPPPEPRGGGGGGGGLQDLIAQARILAQKKSSERSQRGVAGGGVPLSLPGVGTASGAGSGVAGTRTVGSGSNAGGARPSEYFPIQLNSNGMMSIVLGGAAYFGFLPKLVELLGGGAGAAAALSSALVSPLGLVGYGLTVAALEFLPLGAINPKEMAEYFNMMNVGLKGVVPGEPTEWELRNKLLQCKFWGGACLGALAVAAQLYDSACVQILGTSLGTTSLLIIVGAVLQTARQVEGLLEGPKLQRKLDQERAAIQSLSLL
ncbi:hypothetical protein VOLCADRAFT_90455 [Volvox carteri f. nagariensis]|uniref:Uncharacterized protein n=1 Tax=Volvox carteri f. nagariensis TaxID=3068 RepID=D8TUF2_VOLCA|nr:uncharacterized protein VOLCADRAFT_90455 [Volvox carteri f. nagariensis]EFJ48697.1 hypothetical protein VOLCADRAFT_90455 [Volvox carteri f. nagariensis]|eukprot:XP_002950029.1 hypothetical protein VOLCADRAFT_90455 [Volvox carteri f. nagariensis]